MATALAMAALTAMAMLTMMTKSNSNRNVMAVVARATAASERVVMAAKKTAIN